VTWPVLVPALAIFSLQVPVSPDVPIENVALAGLVRVHTKVRVRARPGIFSATIFYNGGCAKIVF
jgi:hypothetical protein